MTEIAPEIPLWDSKKDQFLFPKAKSGYSTVHAVLVPSSFRISSVLFVLQVCLCLPSFGSWVLLLLSAPVTGYFMFSMYELSHAHSATILDSAAPKSLSASLYFIFLVLKLNGVFPLLVCLFEVSDRQKTLKIHWCWCIQWSQHKAHPLYFTSGSVLKLLFSIAVTSI